MNVYQKRALRQGLTLVVDAYEDGGFLAIVVRNQVLVGIAIKDTKEEAALAALTEAEDDER